jgi:hypothetical protein
MGLRKWLSDFFKSEEKRPSVNKSQGRRRIEDVKVGDSIQVEWERISGKIGYLKCLNNDPLTKKILLEATWNNADEVGEKSRRVVFDYNSTQLANFHLLNPQIEIKEGVGSESDITSLQKRMNDVLEKEEYEVAREIQNKIDKLLKS